MTIISTILSMGLAALSGYCLYYPAQSIPKLQRYEPKAEKAAKWSNVAEKKLQDTRQTVGAGLVMTLVSLLSSLQYLLYGVKGFSILSVVWAAGMCYSELHVSGYVKGFWGKERKVPLMNDYNDAISDMMATTELSGVLALGWGLMAIVKLLGY